MVIVQGKRCDQRYGVVHHILRKLLKVSLLRVKGSVGGSSYDVTT